MAVPHGRPIPGRPTQGTTQALTIFTEALGAADRVEEILKKHPHLPGLIQSYVLGNQYAQGIEPFSEMEDVKAFSSMEAALKSIEIAIYQITGKQPTTTQSTGASARRATRLFRVMRLLTREDGKR